VHEAKAEAKPKDDTESMHLMEDGSNYYTFQMSFVTLMEH